jgi:hypothetical protein
MGTVTTLPHVCKPTSSPWYECTCGQNYLMQNGIWTAISRIRAADYKVFAAKEAFHQREAARVNAADQGDYDPLDDPRDAHMPLFKKGLHWPNKQSELVYGSYWAEPSGKGYMIVVSKFGTVYDEYNFWGKDRSFIKSYGGHLLVPDPYDTSAIRHVRHRHPQHAWSRSVNAAEAKRKRRNYVLVTQFGTR